MSAYTIRVELHNATWNDYVNLATKLAAQGVVDVIKGDDGTWYKLPPAEYNYEGDAAIAVVRTVVANIAAQVSSRFAVFVTEALRREWQGLEAVRRASAA
jgi:2,4-dienoyl-CoA reductase-like NADH-dependent reductase (Old Yellow Enzyme family)